MVNCDVVVDRTVVVNAVAGFGVLAWADGVAVKVKIKTN